MIQIFSFIFGMWKKISADLSDINFGENLDEVVS
jgi:hypothetical protein